MPRIERYITKSLNFPNKQDPTEDISRGGVREAEAARPQGGGWGPYGVYRGEGCARVDQVVTAVSAAWAESAPVTRGLADTPDPWPPPRPPPGAGRRPGQGHHANHFRDTQGDYILPFEKFSVLSKHFVG